MCKNVLTVSPTHVSGYGIKLYEATVNYSLEAIPTLLGARDLNKLYEALKFEIDHEQKVGVYFALHVEQLLRDRKQHQTYSRLLGNSDFPEFIVIPSVTPSHGWMRADPNIIPPLNIPVHVRWKPWAYRENPRTEFNWLIDPAKWSEVEFWRFVADDPL